MMEELISCIAKELVTQPEAVTVTKIQKADFMWLPMIWVRLLASKVK